MHYEIEIMNCLLSFDKAVSRESLEFKIAKFWLLSICQYFYAQIIKPDKVQRYILTATNR